MTDDSRLIQFKNFNNQKIDLFREVLTLHIISICGWLHVIFLLFEEDWIF